MHYYYYCYADIRLTSLHAELHMHHMHHYKSSEESQWSEMHAQRDMCRHLAVIHRYRSQSSQVQGAEFAHRCHEFEIDRFRHLVNF